MVKINIHVDNFIKEKKNMDKTCVDTFRGSFSDALHLKYSWSWFSLNLQFSQSCYNSKYIFYMNDNMKGISAKSCALHVISDCVVTRWRQLTRNKKLRGGLVYNHWWHTCMLTNGAQFSTNLMIKNNSLSTHISHHMDTIFFKPKIECIYY
jgi:hypothetical protein